MFWCSEDSFREFKYCSSIPIQELLNSVSSVNFDDGYGKNSAGFLLKHLRLNHPRKIIICHLNINSIRTKFDLLKKMVTKVIDILMIPETKLEGSFPVSQILIKDFCTPFRLDRNKNKDGIFPYIRNHIRSTQLKKYVEKNLIEAFFIELRFKRSK